jgi:hypothetical protein
MSLAGIARQFVVIANFDREVSMRRTGFVIAVILLLASSAAVAADKDTPSILGAIRDLEIALKAAPSNVRTTPPMPSLFSPFRQENGEFVLNTPPPGAATVGCTAVNVSSVARHIEIRFFRKTAGQNGQTSQAGFVSITLQPGEQIAAPDIQGIVVSDLASVYCRMTVVDGTRNDIRGAIALRLNDQVIAALPAE